MLRRSSLLTAVATACVLALPGSAAASTCPHADALPGTAEFAANAESATLCLLNNERAAAGIAPLRSGPAELRGPAMDHARDMVERQYFAHESPEGVTVLQRLTGYTRPSPSWTVGENLAWGETTLGTPASIMQAWMNSPGHRRNILNDTFDEVGIAVVPGAPADVSGPAATYATEFGWRSRATRSPVSNPAPASRSTSGTVGARAATPSRSTTKKTSKAKSKRRCRRVYKKVRRGGKVVRVKKMVCPKKAKSSKKRKAGRKAKASSRRASSRR